jgi:5-methylthioadenosine/S-adenosylhomocysteine deaminase
MRQPNQTSASPANPASRLVRAVPSCVALIALACYDIDQPAPRATTTIAVTTARRSHAPAGEGTSSIVLRGTIITPTGIVKHGYVGIVNGRIVSVSDKRPDIEGATTFDTEGIILPGFVDVHNHLPWNALPPWTPPRLYSNRFQWQSDPVFRQQVRAHFDNLIGDGDITGAGNICDMNAYSEMRAIAGGVTSILTTHRVPCIQGLVRNLDYNSGFYGTTELDREHIINAIEIPAASDSTARRNFVSLARFAIRNPFYEALFLHVSEGVDAFSLEEFIFGQSQGLLNPKGVVIHGIALGPSQFQAMAASGTSLVWSPRSNVTLYGHTADINAALDAGVRIALAPDWAISGSSNMLDELHFADEWNRTQLAGRLTDRQLVDMVTRIPAREARIDDEVGAIVPGLRADLVVINGDPIDPLRAVIEANPDDVRLVLIEGVPLYGDPDALRRFWSSSALETIGMPDGAKALAPAAAGFLFSDVVGRLATAFNAEGISLAPLITNRFSAPAAARRIGTRR